jgi:outer membrane protein OmpA-like peptidoglycan-associated protein/Tol biopolymer transport system component
MKFKLLVLSLLFFASCSTAQLKYSSSNKKAIKLFEQGQEAPRLTLDPKTKLPNYTAGISYLDKALEKDPKFWEAHLLSGEYYEYIGNYEAAISHYEAALGINPNHSPSGSTYFFLANLQHAVGEYEKSLRNLELFIRNRNANPSLVKKAYEIQGNCEFALDALKHPKNFNPINIGPGINTADPEYFPSITVDGKTILFTRRIDDGRTLAKEQEDFYVSELNAQNIWGTSTPMPSNVNTVLNEGAPTISADGRSLIFVACSDQSGDNNYGENRTGKGSCDLFYTKKLGSRWTDPINLPGNVNTFSWESQPSLSADGKTLYFIRRVSKRGEPNDSDIFVSRLLENGQWSTAERLPGNINTPYQEESVLIHPDGKTLYFATRGHRGMGGSDLFVSRMDASGNWSNPENLGYPINTKYDENSLMVSPDGEIAYFASDRKGGFGDLDIYYFTMPEELRPTKTLYFEGIVFDITDRKPVPGKFQLVDLKTGKEVIVSEADKTTGEFMVSLPVNHEYALNVSYPGYTFFSRNFNMLDPNGQKAIHMDVPMVPITNEQPTLLANVFFDFGKATLRSESFIELNKLYDFLKNNPTLKIEIGGHTDTRGDDKDNLKLSNDRAKAVYDYIVAKGMDAKRMSFKGYGETKPVLSDSEIAKLATEQEREIAHQSNRRTEYKILK